MTKKLFTLIVFLFFCQGLSEAGQKIVALQSFRVTPYEKALKGFESVCAVPITKLVLSESAGEDTVKTIWSLRPDLVLAIGMEALQRLKSIQDIPVVYLMVLNPFSLLAGEENITGVSMDVPPEKKLAALLQILPGVKTIGTVYDPRRTGHLVERLLNAAQTKGIKLIAGRIQSPREVPSYLETLKEKIDVFWMLPDITAMTPETVEALFLFSLENKIPILTFSEKYLEMGALISTKIDAFDIGKQAGEMAAAILSGKSAKDIPPADARAAKISINSKVAEKLGVSVGKTVIRDAQKDDKNGQGKKTNEF